MSKFKKAVFIDYKEGDVFPNYLSKITELFDEHKFIQSDSDDLLKELKETEVIFAKISTKIQKDIIDATPNLKYIGVMSTSFSGIDAIYAKEKGITVCNLGGYSTESVAEFAIATLVEKVRCLENAKKQARAEDYDWKKIQTQELRGKTLGVVGAGAIGSRIAEIAASGFGMKIIYFSRTNKPDIEKLGAIKKDLSEVMSEADHIAIGLLHNKETEGIINAESIKSIKKDAVVVNISPMELLDQTALKTATREGNFTFIFDHSDDLTKEEAKEYLGIENVIVYPPIAFYTKEAVENQHKTLAENIEKFAEGNPQNVVNS